MFVIPLFAQDYLPKNDGVRQNFKSQIAITNATVYVSPTQKVEKATPATTLSVEQIERRKSKFWDRFKNNLIEIFNEEPDKPL